MARKKLSDLLRKVTIEVEIAEGRYAQSKEASDVMQETARTSWSGAGDREYALGQKQINKKNLETFIVLQSELKDVPASTLEGIKPPCYVVFEQEDARHELFLVNNVTNIKGFKLTSVESPLGKKLLGKKVGDRIEFGSGKSEAIILEVG